MIRFLSVRLLVALSALFVISIIVTAGLHLALSDQAAKITGSGASDMEKARLLADLGLERSFAGQYAAWFKNLLKGNLGHSLASGMPVSLILFAQLPYTLGLTLTALVLVFVQALAFGYLAAFYPRSRFNMGLDWLFSMLYSAPSFLIASFLIILLAYQGDLFPIRGARTPGEPFAWSDTLHHAVLPVLAIVLTTIGSYFRIIRAEVVEILASDFVRAAKARGLSETSIFFHHILPGAAGPLLSWTGANFASLISGAFVIEYVFAWPGIGAQAVSSALMYDYPMLMGIIVISGVFVVFGSLLAELFNALVNPRMRREHV